MMSYCMYKLGIEAQADRQTVPAATDHHPDPDVPRPL